MQPSSHLLTESLGKLPGFRRRFRITPSACVVCSEVEDDFHCMAVQLQHDGKFATAIDADMRRVPWTTCPGAAAQLKEAFTGVALTAFATCSGKRQNCTHLFDLALLAAAHAFDEAPLVYDIEVSDPVEGRRRAEIRRDGDVVLAWVEAGFQIEAPAELAGMALDKIKPWLDLQEESLQEAARLLRWGNMLANGRIIPLEDQSDAKKMPPGCYTFQPERAVEARRVGVIRDFSHKEWLLLEEAEPSPAGPTGGRNNFRE